MYATSAPSFAAAADPAPPPERTLDGADMEEPPPYTPRPSTYSGETTVEQGPSRPFQPAPQTPSQRRAPLTSHLTGNSSLTASVSSVNRTAGSLLNQLTATLTNSVNSAMNNLNSLQPPPRHPQTWSSYPGQQQQQQSPPPNSYRPPPGPPPLSPPPRHPSSTSLSPNTSSSPTPSSDFARDFYAAGSIDEPAAVSDTMYAPPPGSPPPRLPQRPTNTTNASTSSSITPNDGRPTVQPSIGHPLLKDGKLLVYPKGFECSRCKNIGYKKADPLRPCKRCWSRYAKPFSGPLVYSFSPSSDGQSSTAAQNFQRPLPGLPSSRAPPIPPALSFTAPPAHFAPGGYMTDHNGGFYSPPTSVHPTQTRIGRDITELGRPPPGSIVYSAGDPRIGGMLCWRCNGKGNTSYMILDRITCPVCGGIGRTFD